MVAPLIVSFYTNDWIYPEHASRLRIECDQYNLQSYIVELPTTGDYKANTRMKPKFIRDCLIEFKQPVMWIDVDGYILKHIDINLSGFDMAACKMPPGTERTYRVGTLVFNYTEPALHLLELWVNSATHSTDEAAFETACQKFHGELKVHELSPSIYHLVKSKKVPFSDLPSSTIICHTLSESESKLREKYKK